MRIPTNMTNNQLRLLAKIEKLLFEKRDYPFEELLKQAKKECFYNNQQGDMTTMKESDQHPGIDQDILDRMMLDAGGYVH